MDNVFIIQGHHVDYNNTYTFVTTHYLNNIDMQIIILASNKNTLLCYIIKLIRFKYSFAFMFYSLNKVAALSKLKVARGCVSLFS